MFMTSDRTPGRGRRPGTAAQACRYMRERSSATTPGKHRRPSHGSLAEQLRVTSGDIPDQIRKLGELRDSGVLSAEEFEAKKTELLSRM
ncbi:MAG: SHOCT domain-containing protein [Gaiellaceae bacterium]